MFIIYCDILPTALNLKLNYCHFLTAEKDIVDFLTEEIATEKKTSKKHGVIPKELDGFKIESDGAEVTFTKNSGNET